MYKVFIENKPVFLTQNAGKQPEEEGVLDITLNELSVLHNIVRRIEENEDIKEAFIRFSDEDALWHHFRSLFKPVEAAGGIVENQDKELLFIYRLDKWDLPKGKLEKDESPAQGAVREVEEETGLRNISLLEHRTDTWHTYHRRGKPHLKKTWWYNMKVEGKQELVPQTEEDITEVKWVNKSDLSEVLGNTYGSIADVLLID